MSLISEREDNAARATMCRNPIQPPLFDYATAAPQRRRFSMRERIPPWKRPGARRVRGHRFHYIMLSCPCCGALITSERRISNKWTELVRWLRRAMLMQTPFSRRTKAQLKEFRKLEGKALKEVM